MLRPLFTSATIAAFVIAGAFSPAPTQSLQPNSSQPQPLSHAQRAQPPAPRKPYKQVAVQLPKQVSDPSFEAFRKQLAGIAERKDRAALAKLVARNFFWMSEDKNIADSKKPGIDNLAKAIGLDGEEAVGWDVLTIYAGDPTGDPWRKKKGVICAPGDPQFDENEAEQLAATTETDASEWGYPVGDGVEVRSAPGATSPVSEKLGLYLVRVYPDASPASALRSDVLRIVLPSGKLGFVPSGALLPLESDRLCYVKEGSAWKIAGAIGGAGL
jgi:hypothetical protein